MADKGKTKKKSKTKPKKSRSLMYVQQEPILAQRFKSRQDIENHLKSNFPDCDWAFILHNKDVNPNDKSKKAVNHLHIAFYFDNPRSPSSVAKLMGEPDKNKGSNVEIFTGRWAKQNMFSYLIHATAKAIDEGKHQYNVKEVSSNFDYASYIERSTTTAESKKLDIEDVVAMLIKGDIIYRDFFIDSVLGKSYANATFYANHHNKINKAIETRYKLMMSSKEVDDLEIIYIQGQSGSGKTTFAKEYAKRKYGSYFITGSSNDPVQDYMGEPVAIFDDARPSDFEASDWLKMLDPYNNKSTVTSRYYNKYLAVKCIILTSVTPFFSFFLYAKNKGGVDEPIDQFIRRFKTVIRVERLDTQNSDEKALIRFYDVYKTDEPYPFCIDNTKLNLNYNIKLNDKNNITFTLPKKVNSSLSDDIVKFFKKDDEATL